MRKATSLLVFVLMFFANASFAHGRCGGGGCNSHESSCCKKEMKMCKKEMKCCEREMKKACRYHDASSCGYCQNKDHDCMRDCQHDPCPNHHCDGCYVNNDRNGMVEFNRCSHSCDGCHPHDM